MTSKESSGKPYGLQKAKEDVKRLVVESNGHLLYDSFQSAFRDKYGSDLHPGHFGCMSLLQLLETKMKEIVKVSGATAEDRYVTLRRRAESAGSAGDQAAHATAQGTSKPTSTGKQPHQPSNPQQALQPSVPKQALTTPSKPSSQSSGQPSPAVSHLAMRQRTTGPAIRSPVSYNPRDFHGPAGRGGGKARYPPPVFVAPATTQSLRMTDTGGKRGPQPSTQLIKSLEAQAKDFARECVAKRTHVDSSRICQALLRERNAESFKALGLRGHFDIPYIRELERLQKRVYETITAYCQVRATASLYELGKYLAQMEEKKDFEELGLGPLLEQPPVYQYFKPRRTLVAVPEITTRDVLEYLRSYMDTKDKWRGVIKITDFLKFMTRERGCEDPHELCVRVPSPGLSISVLRKAQRREKEEWHHIRDQIAKETTEQIERKLRMTIEQLLGNNGRQLKPPERSRIEEIAGQPAEEVVRHVFIFLSHRDMFPTYITFAMRKFFNYVASNPFARKLFQLAICNGSMTDLDEPTKELVQKVEVVDSVKSVEVAEAGKPVEAVVTKDDTVGQNSGEDEDEEYDVEWDKKHHRLVVPEGELVGEICAWLNEMEDLNLPALAQIEAKVATRFEAPEFTDLGHKSFLHLATYHPTILRVLDSLTSDLRLQQSGQRQLSGQAQTKQISKEHVFDFLQQCGLGRSPESLYQAVCDHFGAVRVEDLGFGPISKIIQRAKTHNTRARPVISTTRQTFPRLAYQSAILCGSSQLESRVRTMSCKTQGAGMLGWQRPERALQCLLSCPVLEDLAKYSHWDDIFAPSIGPLKEFITTKAQMVSLPSNIHLCAVESEPGIYLRVEPECSVEELVTATAKGDARKAAGQLVSLIIQSGNVSTAPLALVATRMRSALEQLAATVDMTKDNLEEVGHQSFLGGKEDLHKDRVIQFTLRLLVLIPHKLAVAISQQVVLEPMHQIVGAAFAPNLLLQCCSTDQERRTLQRLGIALGIQEWIKDFETQVQQYEMEYVATAEEEQKRRQGNSEDADTAADDEDSSMRTKADKNYQQDEEPELQDTVASDSHSKDDPLEDIADDDGNGGLRLEDARDMAEECRVSDANHPISSVPPQIERKQDTTLESFQVLESSVDPEESPNEEDDDSGMLTASEEEKHCKAVIDDILREEFGVGLNLGPEEEKMIEKQRAREGRGLHRLSSELYSRDTHFVLELVQNADDNSYPDEMCEDGDYVQPAVVFVVTKSCVTVLNNETGFQEGHVRALCDVGRSTKGKHMKGYIGQKGIGFKSVFRVTNVPEVHSSSYHIRFNSNSGPLGYILPHWIPPHDRQTYDEELEGIEGAEGDEWTTKIILPLKSELRGQVKTLAPRFHDVQPSLLLFLNRLRSITIVDKVNKTERQMQRRDLPNGLIIVQHSLGVDRWLVVRRELDATNIKHDVACTQLAIGFPLPEEDVLSLSSPYHQQLLQQKVFAFLPLQSYGFRFIVQADFEVPSSREAVDESSPWNQWIRGEIPALFVEAGLTKFKELSNTSSLDAFCIFARFVPLETEIRGFFQPVARQIMQLLKASKCMPVQKAPKATSDPSEDDDTDSLEWVQPAQVVIARDRLVYDILPVDTLKKQLDLYYLDPKVAEVLNPALANSLGVEALSTHHLIRVAQSVCEVNTNSKRPESNRLSVVWVAKWMVCLNRAIISEYKSSRELGDSLRELPIVPLNNGSFVSLTETTVFFPLSEKRKGQSEANYMDNIHDDLKTVSRQLLMCQKPAENNTVYQLLEDIGVKKLSPREVIHSHILPVLNSGDWQSKRAELVADYLVFVKEKTTEDPKVCPIEKLKACAVVVTNEGLVKPGDEIVHFSSDFQVGESFDFQKLFPEVKWKFIDKVYLERSKATNADQIKSWVTFLLQLGVELSLAIKRRPITFTKDNLAASHWANDAAKWPPSPDDQYQISDYDCPEFLAVVSSVQQLRDAQKRTRMQQLLALFQKTWDNTYSEAISSSVYSGSEQELIKTRSSFHRQLVRTSWIPTKEKYRQTSRKTPPSVLYCPSELFLSEKKTNQLLSFHVHYVDADLSNTNLIEALEIQTESKISAAFMMEKLGEWSGSYNAENRSVDRRMFKTSLNHMSSVYQFILGSCRLGDKDRWNTIRSFFRRETAIFVPCRSDIGKDPRTLVTGSFFTISQVCRCDASSDKIVQTVQKTCNGAVCPGPQLLEVAYSSLESDGCAQILELFEERLAMSPNPSVQSYIELMEYLTSSIPVPNDSSVKDMQALYIEVVRKMEKTALDEAWTRTSKKNPDLPPTIEKFRRNQMKDDRDVEAAIVAVNEKSTVLQNEDATIVRESVHGKKLFASSPRKWVSSTESLFINDDENTWKLFRSSESIQFVHIAREDKLVSKMSKQLATSAVLRNRQHAKYAFQYSNRQFYNAPRREQAMVPQVKEERLEKIHTFLECCGVRKLSESLQKKALYESCSSYSPLEYHVYNVMPYIQRYLLTEHEDVYQKLIDKKLRDKLQIMRCQVAERLEMVYTIEGVDVQTEVQECDYVMSTEGNLFVSSKASRQSLEQYETINRELATFFLHPTHAQFQEFVSFVDSVTARLNDRKKLRDFLKYQDVKKRPDTETKWQLLSLEVNCVDEPDSCDEDNDEIPYEAPPPLPPIIIRDPYRGTNNWPPGSSTLPHKFSAQKHTKDQQKKEEWPMPSRSPRWQGSTEQNALKHPKETSEIGSVQQEDKTIGTNQTEGTADAVNSPYASVDNPAVPPYFQQTLLQPFFPGHDPTAQNGQASLLPPLFPPPLTASLQSELPPIQFEPVATAAQLQYPVSLTLNSRSTLQEISRYGEELVYLFFQQQKELGMLQYNGEPSYTVAVNWVNEDDESGKPYDIEIQFSLPDQSTPQSFFIEVKTTLSSDKGIFEISSRQIQFAQEHGHMFQLYRVFNAGRGMVQLYRLQNLAQYLDTNQVKLYMVI